MAVIHIVLFEFKPSAQDTQVAAVRRKKMDEHIASLMQGSQACERMLALPTTCKHPSSGRLYVKSHGGGRNSSTEGLTGGSTHGFVFEFENESDRDYYVNSDPDHLAFVGSIGDVVQSARVLDFTPGVL
ncbi:hypothetical protein CAC42_4795 [Sphaceloma murrayae]|uniref:Stress-response A/B barrel domain-containing protein n=1 Tax=Sphaceloma murrayae TaxID=2082308 RepID=A0A2K1QPA1_9PEZI|nr:hypothetical protein CAC42_4795 [Sphaceloma murrayae]